MAERRQLIGKRLMWLARWLIIAELAYLAVLNSLLQLPLTQTAVNAIRPEKFHVTWENAWTPWPFRIHLTGGHAHGNARSQIWEVRADSVAGSIALLPLVMKQVWLSDLSGSGVTYRQRPRPRADRDHSNTEAYFPVIGEREVTPAVTGPQKTGRGWKLRIRDIEITGPTRYWIHNLQGGAQLALRGDIDYRSRGGPLALDLHHLSMELQPHFLNGDRELFQRGTIEGSMGFAEFYPRENRGLKLLDHLFLDVTTDIDANELEFINLFLLNFDRVTVTGTGHIGGRLNYRQGWVKPGTALHVDAADLEVGIMSAEITGSGVVRLDLGPETGNSMDLVFTYRDLEIRHDEDDEPMLSGEDMVLRMGGDGRLRPEPGTIDANRTIALELERLTVPDLALFQRFLPTQWPVTLHGGEGALIGTVFMAPQKFSVDLALDSDNADLSLDQYRMSADLDASLKLDNPDVLNHRTAVDGSFLALTDASLVRADEPGRERWTASLSVERGKLRLFDDEAKQDSENVVDVFGLFGDHEVRDMLQRSDGTFDFNAEVSSLAWLGILMKSRYRSRLSGSALLSGTAHLRGGRPEAGTEVTIQSNELSVAILDYVCEGTGRISLDVVEGESSPIWDMAINLDGASMKSRGDEKAYIQDVALALEARVEDVDFSMEGGKPFDLGLKIPAARVSDMTVFNRHLPADGSVRFTGGQAKLSADILLRENDADGWLSLTSSGLDAVWNEQALVADLALDIRIDNGLPQDMFFDFSGSELLIDNVRVSGDRNQFDDEVWSAHLLMTQATTTWTRPAQVALTAELAVSDSRPFVALFNNQGWKPKFLTRALTVEDITGHAQMSMADNEIRLPLAHVSGEHIEAGAKGVFGGDANEGIVYARIRNMDAVIRFSNGKKNLDILRALEKYRSYELPPR